MSEDVEQWPIGEGVVQFPNGVRVRGHGLRRVRPDGPAPTIGVYLLARRPPPMPWQTEWIRWPDFRLPSDPDAAIGILASVFALGSSARIEIGCRGGVGRTGTALAVLAVESGIEPGAAVSWIREHYHSRAVETPWQRCWIETLRH